MSQRRLLIPLDGSAFAEAVLPYGLGIAERLRAAVELVSVYPDTALLADWHVGGDALRVAHAEYLEHLIDRLKPRGAVPITSAVIGGPVDRALEQHVNHLRPDLVVMSTHGRGPVSRAWLGSVADRLVRHLPVPLVLVRPSGEEVPDPDARPELHTIVAALDGSDRAETVLPWTARLARAYGARLVLLRVVPPAYTLAPYFPQAVHEAHGAMKQEQQEAQRYLKGVAARFKADGIATTADVVMGVTPGTTITRHARALDADLVALATHGRGGVARLVLGSVADKVIRDADSPVLVARPMA
jgi:nucleotide-binding universal stress UspA family protein